MKASRYIPLIAVFLIFAGSISAEERGCCLNPKFDREVFCNPSSLLTQSECCGTDADCASKMFKPNAACDEEDKVPECKKVCCKTTSSGRVVSAWAYSPSCPKESVDPNIKNEIDCLKAGQQPQCNNFDDKNAPVDDDKDQCANLNDADCENALDETEDGKLPCKETQVKCSDPKFVPIGGTLKYEILSGPFIKLSWSNLCSKEGVYKLKKKHKSSDEPIADGPGIFEYTDRNVKFDESYIYYVEWYNPPSAATPLKSNEVTVSTGNVKCAGKNENYQFCENNKGYICQNKVPNEKAGTDCGAKKKCVIESGEAKCIEIKCDVADSDPFGLYHVQDKCERKGGNPTFCFYDNSKTIANSCFSCITEDGTPASCYDYKSESTCNRDPCGVKKGAASPVCEWKKAGGMLNRGVCANKEESNCKWCGESGTKDSKNVKIGSSDFFSSIFDACTPQKSSLLSTDKYRCYYKEGLSKQCGEISCGDYKVNEECPTGDVLLNGNKVNDARNDKKDPCGIKVCKKTASGCIKDADDRNEDDCAVDHKGNVLGPSDKVSCNLDRFPPTTKLTLKMDAEGKANEIGIDVLDKKTLTEAESKINQPANFPDETKMLYNENYKTYLCLQKPGETKCQSSKHGSPAWSEFTRSRNLGFAGINIFREFRGGGNLMFRLEDNKPNEIWYYTQDPANNVEPLEKEVTEINNGQPVKIIKINKLELWGSGSGVPRIKPGGMKVFDGSKLDGRAAINSKLYARKVDYFTAEFTAPINSAGDGIVPGSAKIKEKAAANPISLSSDIIAGKNDAVRLTPPQVISSAGDYSLELSVKRGNLRMDCPKDSSCPQGVIIDQSNPNLRVHSGLTELKDGVAVKAPLPVTLNFTETSGILLESVEVHKAYIKEDSTVGYKKVDLELPIAGSTEKAKQSELKGFFGEVNTADKGRVEITKILQLQEDGDYKIVVKAKDFVDLKLKEGGSEIEQKEASFVVDSKALDATGIRLVSPKYGISGKEVFDVVIETENSAECQWSVAKKEINGRKFDETGSILHILRGFRSKLAPLSIADGEEVELSVACVSNGNRAEQKYMVGYDTKKPVIVLKKVFPDEYLEGSEAERGIYAVSGSKWIILKQMDTERETTINPQKTLCSYSISLVDKGVEIFSPKISLNDKEDISGFKSSYQKDVDLNSIKDNAEHKLRIECKSRAEIPNTKDIKFKIFGEKERNLIIGIISPAATKTSDSKYSIVLYSSGDTASEKIVLKTNKDITCHHGKAVEGKTPFQIIERITDPKYRDTGVGFLHDSGTIPFQKGEYHVSCDDRFKEVKSSLILDIDVKKSGISFKSGYDCSTIAVDELKACEVQYTGSGGYNKFIFSVFGNCEIPSTSTPTDTGFSLKGKTAGACSIDVYEKKSDGARGAKIEPSLSVTVNIFGCTKIPPYTSVCTGTDKGLDKNTDATLAASCSYAVKCEYFCDPNIAESKKDAAGKDVCEAKAATPSRIDMTSCAAACSNSAGCVCPVALGCTAQGNINNGQTCGGLKNTPTTPLTITVSNAYIGSLEKRVIKEGTRDVWYLYTTSRNPEIRILFDRVPNIKTAVLKPAQGSDIQNSEIRAAKDPSNVDVPTQQIISFKDKNVPLGIYTLHVEAEPKDDARSTTSKDIKVVVEQDLNLGYVRSAKDISTIDKEYKELSLSAQQASFTTLTPADVKKSGIDDSEFFIEIGFNKNIETIESVTFVGGGGNSNIKDNFDPVSGQSGKYRTKAANSIKLKDTPKDRPHQLMIKAKDLSGSIKDFPVGFFLDAYELSIFLEEPRYGWFAKEMPSRKLLIKTDKPSVCGYKFNAQIDMSGPLQTTNDLTRKMPVAEGIARGTFKAFKQPETSDHIIDSFNDIQAENAEREFYVKCEDSFGNKNDKRFIVGIDSNSDLSFDGQNTKIMPNPIEELPYEAAILAKTNNKPVVCKYHIKGGANAVPFERYSEEYEYVKIDGTTERTASSANMKVDNEEGKVAVSAAGAYEYTLICRDRAFRTIEKVLPLTARNGALEIFPISAGPYILGTNVNLEIETTKNAVCTYSVKQSPLPADDIEKQFDKPARTPDYIKRGRHKFTKLLGQMTKDGTYTYKITCT